DPCFVRDLARIQRLQLVGFQLIACLLARHNYQATVTLHESAGNLYPKEIFLSWFQIPLHARLLVIRTEGVFAGSNRYREVTTVVHARELHLVAIDRRRQCASYELLVTVDVNFRGSLVRFCWCSSARILCQGKQTREDDKGRQSFQCAHFGLVWKVIVDGWRGKGPSDVSASTSSVCSADFPLKLRG